MGDVKRHNALDRVLRADRDRKQCRVVRGESIVSRDKAKNGTAVCESLRWHFRSY